MRLAWITLLVFSAARGLEAQSRRVEPGSLAAPVTPSRRTPAPPPPAIPSLPEHADRVSSLTVEVTVARTPPDGRPGEVRQVVSRTADRVHIAAGQGEWLFERNPLDHRRVSGQYVDHHAQTIVSYSDTDLLNLQNIPGWLHVLTLGCDVPPVEPATAGPPRAIGALRFQRHAAPGREVWWNRDELLPAECTTADGAMRLLVTAVRPDVAPDLLRQPAARFPHYRDVDVAEWLEHR